VTAKKGGTCLKRSSGCKDIVDKNDSFGFLFTSGIAGRSLSEGNRRADVLFPFGGTHFFLLPVSFTLKRFDDYSPVMGGEDGADFFNRIPAPPLFPRGAVRNGYNRNRMVDARQENLIEQESKQGRKIFSVSEFIRGDNRFCHTPVRKKRYIPGKCRRMFPEAFSAGKAELSF
jgi:hypothetical protein